jgi:predicted Zn-dependent protease
MRENRYHNPKVPEEISSGHDHPLWDAVKSFLLVSGFIVAVVAACFIAARLAAPLTPFSWETALIEKVAPSFHETKERAPQTEAYLRRLAARLTKVMDLPDGVTVTVHYVKGKEVNAFATLGGHIVIYEGLWRKIDSENTAAMLLGHEIAHVKHRDPIASAGGGLVAAVILTALVGNSGFLGDLLGAGGTLAVLRFSRAQEEKADRAAARAVLKLYGHLNGAGDLFAKLRSARGPFKEPPKFLSSHPHLADRVATLKRDARARGWPLEGPKTPLP